MIQQGEVYWLDLGSPTGHGLAYRHPYVVVQGNLFNQSKIHTTVVCGITSKLNRAGYSGSVLLQKGEANLPKESVVNITQLYTVDRDYLVEKIGALSAERVVEIIKGIKILLDTD